MFSLQLMWTKKGCDYSLGGIQNRLAEVNETLVVHKFYTGSKGLASPKDLKSPKLMTIRNGMGDKIEVPDVCAVCIPDGAQLTMKVPFSLQAQHNLAAVEKVTFRQLTIEGHRDAVEFGKDLKLRLQELVEGIPMTVLSLEGATLRTPVREAVALVAR